jgi:hypothetical protein
MAYAREVRPASIGDLPYRLVSGLVFAGGCALPAIALAPCLWSRRGLAAGAALFLLILVGPPLFGSLRLAFVGDGFGAGALCQNAWLTLKGTWPLELQRALWLLSGLSIAALAIADYWGHRDAPSALLGLWVFGVLIFASLCNWTINGRSILPLLPAVGILLARRLETFGSLPLNRGGDGSSPAETTGLRDMGTSRPHPGSGAQSASKRRGVLSLTLSTFLRRGEREQPSASMVVRARCARRVVPE